MVRPKKISAFVDAEWASTGESLSLQVLLDIEGFDPELYMVVNSNYKTHFQKIGLKEGFVETTEVPLPYTLSFDNFSDETDHLTALIQKSLSRKDGDFGGCPEKECERQNEKMSEIDSEDSEKTPKSFCDRKGKKHSIHCNLFFFYSPKDLWISLGWNQFKTLLDPPQGKGFSLISQKRNISGTFSLPLESKPCEGNNTVTYKLKDLSGWTNSSFYSLAQGLGLDVAAKTSLDNYKSCMENAVIDHTGDFISYSLNDVVLLKKVLYAQVGLINWLTKEVLDVPVVFTPESIPTTQGSLVTTIFENYLENLLRYNYKANLSWSRLLKLTYAKLGVLNPENRGYAGNLKAHETLMETKNLSYFGTPAGKKIAHRLTHSFGQVYSQKAFSQAGIQSFLQFHSDNTGIYNSLVHGGRCVSERYREYRDDYCADVDLSSCYGSALRDFAYPIGLPTLYAKTPNEKGLTLGDFLKNYESRLVPNQYQILVSGNLSFSQSLVFSKLTTPGRIKRFLHVEESKFGSSGSDGSHIDADFVLIQKEIMNGVITADVLELLRAVCSNQELKEFYKLEVVTACYWDKCLECRTLEEWVERVFAADGNYVFDLNGQSCRDSRPRYWYRLPLEKFIGKLVDERIKRKAEMAREANPIRREKLKARQQILKLIINVFYGVTASPYFSVGNTVLANNITARARVECWKLSRALNLHCSITDGGFYSLNSVHHLVSKNKKPSLSALSDLYTLKEHRSIRTGPLGSVCWAVVFDDPGKHHLFKDLDEKAWDHLNKFWGEYELKMKIAIEHKQENTALVASHWSKAHYAFWRRDPNTFLWNEKVYSIRGARLIQGLKPHPCYEILTACGDDSDFSNVDLEYQHMQLLRPAKWLEIQKSKTRSEVEKNVRPGEALIETRRYRLNNLDKPIFTIKEYKQRVNRGARKDQAVLFERVFPAGIKPTVDALNKDYLPKSKNQFKHLLTKHCFDDSILFDVAETTPDVFVELVDLI